MRLPCAVLAVLVLLTPRALVAQYSSALDQWSTLFGVTLQAIPAVDTISSDWENRFAEDEDLINFRLLRAYRAEKQELLERLNPQVATLRVLRETAAASSRSEIGTLRELVQRATGDSIYIGMSLPVSLDTQLGGYTPGNVSVENARAALQTLVPMDSAYRQYLADVDAAQRLLAANVRIVENDIRSVEAAIDSALDPEYDSMMFRIWVSGFFSVLIAVMILAFFGTIFRRSDANIGTLLLSDGGLQFVTIFVLIIAIILFGILNILEGRELAAILSGIAGYILGRGAHVGGDAAGGGQGVAGGQGGAERDAGRVAVPFPKAIKPASTPAPEGDGNDVEGELVGAATGAAGQGDLAGEVERKGEGG